MNRYFLASLHCILNILEGIGSEIEVCNDLLIILRNRVNLLPLRLCGCNSLYSRDAFWARRFRRIRICRSC